MQSPGKLRNECFWQNRIKAVISKFTLLQSNKDILNEMDNSFLSQVWQDMLSRKESVS